MSKADYALKLCPLCKIGEGEMLSLMDEEHDQWVTPNFKRYYVQCKRCGAQTNLFEISDSEPIPVKTKKRAAWIWNNRG